MLKRAHPKRKGRGLAALEIGTRIKLLNPEGRYIYTQISSIEALFGPEVKDRIAILLPNDLDKMNVPSGTKLSLPGPLDGKIYG